MKSYSGIGSRQIPQSISKLMTNTATELQNDYILRSGGAGGADLAFENGVFNDNKEIYIPWKGFNGSNSKLFIVSEEAKIIASKYHPNWKNLKSSVQCLHARNVSQVLGININDPVRFVLTWTQDGCESAITRSPLTGGTGQAIAIASAHNIPVINMFNDNWVDRLLYYLDNDFYD